jgi:EmrB/QacA subfamily drug resistance transporter
VAATTGTAPVGDAVDPRAWKVLGVCMAGVFVVFLDATVVNIAFPALSADFAGTTRAGLSWVLNAYAVVFGALLVTAGRLADARGRRRAFLTGLVVFAVASGLCGVAPSVPLLVAARALQAVGAALLVPASLALLLPEFPASKRATAVGLWGAAGAVAAASGPVLGALLVEGPGWRWVFYVNLPFCAAAVLLGRRVLRESTGTVTTSRPDVLGVLLVTAVFGLLSLGIVQGEQWGWSSIRVVGALLVAVLLTPVLVLRSLRHPDPALPVDLFRVRSFSAATAATLLFGAAFFAMILCNVLFLTEVWGYSILRTAVAVLPSPLLAAVSAPIAGRLADRYGFRVVVVPGALSMVAAQLWFLTRTTADPDWLTAVLPGSVLAGLAIGFAFAALGAAGAQALPPAQFGAGSAVGATARQLGAVVGVAGLVAVLGEPAPAEALASFHRAWGAIAVAAGLCAVVSLGLGPRRTS